MNGEVELKWIRLNYILSIIFYINIYILGYYLLYLYFLVDYRGVNLKITYR